ncbi:MAG: DEAD/DEAH box helicase [Acidobacteria bacterium]|nr:DEAD/DEAH box helicase [Acidobacteriota bacterium]
MSFSEMGLDKELASRCESLKYLRPTPIQRQAIPVIMDGRDLIGCAATGTGKTAAFLLPVLNRLMGKARPGVRVLIIAPTRELAVQIEESLVVLSPSRAIRSVTLMGGASMDRQLKALRNSPAVVIATPGRLMDHIERQTIDLAAIETLVLDEADRMLDMGFWPVIRQVIERLPVGRQTLLFSATMSPDIEKLARTTMRRPALVEVSPRGRTAVTVEQRVYAVASESKTALLLHLLEDQEQSRVLVFTRTRRSAERLSHILAARGHKVNRLHADRTQAQRQGALHGFREGLHRILVATDIASRGIDVESVSHVINYDVPEAPEDYVHRIGRTGRAGKTGKAITLVSPVDELSLVAIERLIGRSIERVVLPDFGGLSFGVVASGKAVGAIGSPAPARGFRPSRPTRRARR